MPLKRVFRRLVAVNPTRSPGPVLVLFAGVVTTLAGGCASASAPASQANLDATLWVQSSAEYGTVTRSVYRAALEDLPLLEADSTRSAALEQEAPFSTLPPAVILDVDETVLDNVPYQARLLIHGESYASDTWAEWVEERTAESVPGALEFARGAAGLGITVFYVTNRRSHLEPATRDNLAALGFPLRSDIDVVLTRGERPGWDGSKSSRRQAVAGTHRVVMIVGDDLNDFVDVDGLPVDTRGEVAERHESDWGRRWRMLPNPTYGSWERALYGFDNALSQEDRTSRKAQHLEPKGENHE
jgi:acid phosphatase